MYTSPTPLRRGFDDSPSRLTSAEELQHHYGWREIDHHLASLAAPAICPQPSDATLVDHLYDAWRDLAHMLGMPWTFIPLGQRLSLHLASTSAEHGDQPEQGTTEHQLGFDPDNWNLHLHPQHSCGLLAQYFGTALDAWIASNCIAQDTAPAPGATPKHSPYASEHLDWIATSSHDLATALRAWTNRLPPYRADAPTPWRWVEPGTAHHLAFARGFAVMIFDAMLIHGRANSMLASGMSETDTRARILRGQSMLYPIAGERVQACRLMAAIVRAAKQHYRRCEITPVQADVQPDVQDAVQQQAALPELPHQPRTVHNPIYASTLHGQTIGASAPP